MYASLRTGKTIYGVPNWVNRALFHGDNINFLRAMNSNSVHLIATDPPFNKGRDFHSTPSSLASGASFHDRWSWDNDIHQDWVDQITDDWPFVMNVIEGSKYSYGKAMGAYLCYMGVRLISMRRVLRDDGSIYLHCDPTASHYLKELMDAIFGKKNFRNEIIWYYTNSGGRSKRYFAKKHDVILWYSKTNNYFFDGTQDGQGRSAGTTSKGRKIYKKGGKTYQQIWSNKKSYTYCISDDRIADDVWGIEPLPPHSKKRTGYPTQKPPRLYERIIKTSSRQGDIVLDPFCGCGTTCVVAEKFGRQWVGIDIWDEPHEVVISLLEKEGLLGHFKLGDINYTTELPERTDDGETASPFLETELKIDEPKGLKMSRQDMLDYLLDQHGYKCQGCDREFDDPRYLELDHNTPRSDGGLNHISNRVLLCAPCNKVKSNKYTLSGLRSENKKNGWMVTQSGPAKRG